MQQRNVRILLAVCTISLCSCSLRVVQAATNETLRDPCGTNSIDTNCVWTTRAAPSEGLIEVYGTWNRPVNTVPVVSIVSSSTEAAGPVSGYTLALRRLSLATVDVPAPDTVGTPVLFPLGLYAAPGKNLLLWDVRMVVSEQDFQQYLTFFQVATAHIHTDSSSFVHISAWDSTNTQLRQVTLLSGPCMQQQPALYLQPTPPAAAAGTAGAAATSTAAGGCNVHTVNNATLNPTLQQDAAVPRAAPLLVFITANVSLGYGLRPGELGILRPVAMAGLYSVPTSVDFGMVVNQLNVTSATSAMFWESLHLENMAPGDAVSSIMAPPYSGALSLNIWPMYCNRSAPYGQQCTHVHNVTMVLASQQELDYVTFMYSMYNSPLPNLRQLTDFYRTDLKVKWLQFVPGPGDNAVTVLNMSSLAFALTDVVYSLDPVVAPKLPVPPGLAANVPSTRAGPLVQGVQDCSGLQGALQYQTSNNRLHILMLLSNVSIAQSDAPGCWQDGTVSHPTQVYGQEQSRQMALKATAAGNTTAETAAQAAASMDASATATVPEGMFALDFGFQRTAFILPIDAEDKYLQIQNVTLLGLPQGAEVQQAIKQAPNGVSVPQAWTLLLWSMNRTNSGSPVYLSNIVMLVPQAEYDFMANTARGAPSFVVQLAGSQGLTFSSLSLVGNSVVIGAFQGPGIAGQNVWLLADPSTALMSDQYVWPLGMSAAVGTGKGGSSDNNATVRVAVGVSVGTATLIAVLGLGIWIRLRQRQRQYSAKEAFYGESGKLFGADVNGSSLGGSRHGPQQQQNQQQQQPDVSINVSSLIDKQSAVASRNLSPALATTMIGKDCTYSSSGIMQHADAASEGSVGSHNKGPRNADAVARGLERWKAAISSTAMQLMERRMQSLHSTPSSYQGSNDGASLAAAPGTGGTVAGGPAGFAAATGDAIYPGALISETIISGQAVQHAAVAAPTLQLQEVLGQGSFGCVYLAMWHGKRVAVKVMQLPANALGDHPMESTHVQFENSTKLTLQEWQQRQRAHQQQHKSPHMAIVETVVSSTMSHPNVVQVYTYMINPLTVGDKLGRKAGSSVSTQNDAAASEAGEGCPAKPNNISGWELKLIMEYCDQGTLRDALDRQWLIKGSGATFLQPSLVLSLAHDVAAAMLHLHSQGVVHGDLKAANIMLTKNGEDPSGAWRVAVGYKVVAKVADFGLALTLDSNDTHATMAARGTPTHMAPELFMLGHVSKASDVYAYGILLYEMMTGQRAFAGVPLPLLPYEVARQGLQPEWPPGLPSGCRALRKLAEACWAQQPQGRPSFLDVFHCLDNCQAGKDAVLPAQPRQQAAGMQGAQQQQQQQQQPLRQQPAFVAFGAAAMQAARTAGKQQNMSWSEVTFGRVSNGQA